MSDRIKIENSRFGPLEVDEADIIEFNGMPGFPDAHRFVVMEHAETSVFSWLVSLDDPGLALVIANPWDFFPSYDPAVRARSRPELKLESSDDLAVVTVVALRGAEVSLNLSAPLLINVKERLGIQVVLDDPRLSVREPIRIPKARAAKQVMRQSPGAPGA